MLWETQKIGVYFIGRRFELCFGLCEQGEPDSAPQAVIAVRIRAF